MTPRREQQRVYAVRVIVKSDRASRALTHMRAKCANDPQVLAVDDSYNLGTQDDYESYPRDKRIT